MERIERVEAALHGWHLLPNEASLIRLVSDVLMEVSEEWESEKTYFKDGQLDPVPPQLEMERAFRR
ncbi:MAG: hypothetical protein ACR2JB_13405 [Bryobacteraceae bacterium]